MASATSRDMSNAAAVHPATHSGSARQAWHILHFAFTAVPIIAGADKFLHWLVNWDIYLCEPARRILGEYSHEFMLAVGVIEIVAGLGVAMKPRIFAYVVAAWLGGIIINLLLTGTYFDIALRDFGLMLGELALGRLSAGVRR